MNLFEPADPFKGLLFYVYVNDFKLNVKFETKKKEEKQILAL